MKKITSFAIAALFVLTMTDCKKKGTDSCTSETQLAATTTPALNSTEPPSPGPTFPLRVSITTALPPSGVTITVSAHPEGSNTNFFSETRSSTTANNDFTITGTPQTTSSIVEISITSKSCATNKVNGSYRYSRK